MDEKITITFSGTKEMNKRLKKFTKYKRQKGRVIFLLIQKIFEDLTDDEINDILSLCISAKLKITRNMKF